MSELDFSVFKLLALKAERERERLEQSLKQLKEEIRKLQEGK